MIRHTKEGGKEGFAKFPARAPQAPRESTQAGPIAS